MKLQFERLSYRFGWLSWLAMLVCVLSLLIAYFPVHWLTSSMANKTNCQVSLSQPTGTIWEGSAQLGFSEIKSSASQLCQRPQALSERFSWKSQCTLFAGQCKWMIQYPNAERPLEFTVQPARLMLSGNQIELSPELIEVLGGPLRSLHLRGKLIIRWEDLILDSSPKGLVEVQFLNATSAISPIKPLGSYGLTFQIDRSVMIELATIKGALLLAGKGLIEKGRLSFQGEASARPEAIDSLIGLLSVIGRKDGIVYRFNI